MQLGEEEEYEDDSRRRLPTLIERVKSKRGKSSMIDHFMGCCLSGEIKSTTHSPFETGVISTKLKENVRTLNVMGSRRQNVGEVLSSSNITKFSFDELRIATGNFRSESVLGEGGFGSVFKGWIDEQKHLAVTPGCGLVIAVKKLWQQGLQGHYEWLTEINYLGQLKHPNLVKLLGYCVEGDQRLLVYEYMPKGSMDNHLFRKGSHSQAFSWSRRMKIALGAAKGLAFLHSAEAKVIYRDFKSSNILLDSNYTAKLSDFGLARDGPTDSKTHVSTRVLGSMGYAAPEYVMTGHLSMRSDVYSFGVVLLEMLTGRKVIDKNRPSGEQSLVDWARPHMKKGKIFRIIDARLEGQYFLGHALKATTLALRCLSLDPKSRPTMDEVVQLLEQIQGQEMTEPVKTKRKEKKQTSSNSRKSRKSKK